MGSGGSKPKPNAQKNPAPPANYNQDQYQQQQYPQQQQAMNNSQARSSPPVRSNTKPPSIPPVDNQPVRQKTQVNPIQANPMPQSQTPATQSVAQSMRSMSQPVLPQVEPIKGTQLPQRIMTEHEEMPQQEQEDAPTLLFLFDFTEKVFYYYNTVSNEWKYNDLTNAMDNCPRCPLMKYKQEGEEAAAVQFGKYMSYIALSDETVYLVGGYNSFFSCLVYDIKKNSFVTCSPINVCRNNPTLCRFNGFIYAVSGDQIDSYSNEVSVYDTQNDEWTALPDLPYPQGFSSASVIFGKKLAVLGGLTIKFPRTYTPLLSLYTFGQHDWEVFDLTKVFTQRIPRFINCAMVQNREGDLIILGCEGTKNVFKFDLDNLQLTSCGKIPEEDTFAMPMRSKEVLFRNNLVHCLSHKLELKVYQGYLALEKWEVV